MHRHGIDEGYQQEHAMHEMADERWYLPKEDLTITVWRQRWLDQAQGDKSKMEGTDTKDIGSWRNLET